MPDEDWARGWQALAREWTARGLDIDDADELFDFLANREDELVNASKPGGFAASSKRDDVPQPAGYASEPQLPLGTDGPPPVALRRDGSAGTLGPIDPRVLEQLQAGRSGRALHEDTIHVPGSVEHGRGILVPVSPPEPPAPPVPMSPKEAARLGGSIAADFTPVLGQAKGIYEAALGEDPITGSKLSAWQRALSLVAIIPFGAVFKLGKLGKVAGKVAKVEKIAGEAEKIAVEAEKVASQAEKAAGQAGKSTKVPKEGIYEFPDAMARGKPYIGQSGDISRRLREQQQAGRLGEGTTAKTSEVSGGQAAREVVEHKRIQEITGGVPARHSTKVANQRDPIGPKRRHLLDQ